MKITESKIRKIMIEDILNSHRLDPVSVYLEDFEPRKGKITISCFGVSWTAGWSGMGDRTISQFFCSCDNGYLIENLAGNMNPGVIDEEKSINVLKNRVIECRRGCCENGNTFDSLEAREAWEEVSEIEHPKDWIQSNSDLAHKLIGDEWWHFDFPEQPNPDYVYLSRIIDTVKEALKPE